MRLYAELDRVRQRQVVGDLAALGAILVSLLLGVMVHGLVAVAAAPGELVEDAGETVGGVPGLGGVGSALAEAGRAQQEAVLSVAFWLGFGVAVVGAGVVLLAYLPGRLTWMREAASAAALRDSAGEVLLAYRAMARRPLSRIAAAVPDPSAPLAPGDHRRLANLELEELGLRPAP